MNFLAHAYLSFGDPKVLLGNFIGDFVRGNLEKIYDRDVVVGVKLHREIDFYTDRHPAVKEIQTMLKPKFGRYATIITDMYFDYFLAKYWDNYHSIPLEEFSFQVYEIIEDYPEILPKNFLHTFYYMKKQNWLYAYRNIAGIKRAMEGMAKRASFKSNMETAHLFLEEHHEVIRELFIAFFEDLVAFAKIRLAVLKSEI
ncbi:acyl carrier protein phosphodiesterase [Pararhodonellum marinum]|uniref:acyl carrier protein phosphodiesterase n=1 Tax=Pararhodonellum marinum TaxID=2755358 RepID=UPI00188FD7D5|nr:ACP phosphodiesterase [Pararhodonellum marinum]